MITNKFTNTGSIKRLLSVISIISAVLLVFGSLSHFFYYDYSRYDTFGPTLAFGLDLKNKLIQPLFYFLFNVLSAVALLCYAFCAESKAFQISSLCLRLLPTHDPKKTCFTGVCIGLFGNNLVSFLYGIINSVLTIADNGLSIFTSFLGMLLYAILIFGLVKHKDIKKYGIVLAVLGIVGTVSNFFSLSKFIDIYELYYNLLLIYMIANLLFSVAFLLILLCDADVTLPLTKSTISSSPKASFDSASKVSFDTDGVPHAFADTDADPASALIALRQELARGRITQEAYDAARKDIISKL